MLTALKDRLFQHRLSADARQQPPPAVPLNFGNARAVIVLFPADEATDRKAVDKWRDALRKATNTKIKLAGYFHQSVGATDFGFPAITPANLNWYGVPQGEPVEEYRTLECEILLRLGPPDHRELDYLAVSKDAALKVGPHRPGHPSPYHLQFDASGTRDLREQLAAIERIFSFTNA